MKARIEEKKSKKNIKIIVEKNLYWRYDEFWLKIIKLTNFFFEKLF